MTELSLEVDNTEDWIANMQQTLRDDLAKIRFNSGIEMAAFWVELTAEEVEDATVLNTLATFAQGLRNMKEDV